MGHTSDTVRHERSPRTHSPKYLSANTSSGQSLLAIPRPSYERPPMGLSSRIARTATSSFPTTFFLRWPGWRCLIICLTIMKSITSYRIPRRSSRLRNDPTSILSDARAHSFHFCKSSL